MELLPNPPRDADGALADGLLTLLRPGKRLPALDAPGDADCFLLPGKPDCLTDFNVGVAVMVGVASKRVIVVALLGRGTRFGINVGLFLDENGVMTGVIDGFLGLKVRRDFFLLFVPSSSSSYLDSVDDSDSVVTEPSKISVDELILLFSVVVVVVVVVDDVVLSVLNVLLSLVTIVESPEITATCENKIFFSLSVVGTSGFTSANRLSMYVPKSTVGDADEISGSLVG